MEKGYLKRSISRKKISDISTVHLEKEEKNRMFNFIMKTWNPVVGCRHDCCYCWARKLAETKLKKIDRYKHGFTPKIIDKELSKHFKNEIVFVSDMGDLWGEWVPKEWILAVLAAIKRSPETNFFFLTKNPNRYLEFLNLISENAILGATVETNRNTSVYSKAPLPETRLKAMQELRYRWNNNIMVSIEPIMDFDLFNFLDYLKMIQPNFVVIGKDNYRNNLSEPDLEKIMSLARELDRFTTVIFKNSLKKQIFQSID